MKPRIYLDEDVSIANDIGCTPSAVGIHVRRARARRDRVRVNAS